MKRSVWLIYSVTLLAGMAWFGRSTPAFAAEDRNIPVERLERLEQRVNQMAEQQEQLMRRLGAQMERQAQMGQPAGQNRGPRLAPLGARPPGVQTPGAPGLVKGVHDTLRLLFFVWIVCNILLSIWIFTDIRKRGEGSGIFIALALVAGIPAAIIYTLTRIGDKRG